jgi:hypothetical protein
MRDCDALTGDTNVVSHLQGKHNAIPGVAEQLHGGIGLHGTASISVPEVLHPLFITLQRIQLGCGVKPQSRMGTNGCTGADVPHGCQYAQGVGACGWCQGAVLAAAALQHNTTTRCTSPGGRLCTRLTHPSAPSHASQQGRPRAPSCWPAAACSLTGGTLTIQAWYCQAGRPQCGTVARQCA